MKMIFKLVMWLWGLFFYPSRQLDVGEQKFGAATGEKWFKANAGSATQETKVDNENGVLRGVVIAQVGEAKGHGVWLDKKFLADLVEMGNNTPQKKGVKARFDHPSMSTDSFGKFIGWYRNFKLSEDGTKATADLYLEDVADEAPGGTYKSYILKMAETNPEAFGNSIVFLNGDYRYKNKKGEEVSYEDYEKLPKADRDPNTYSTIKSLLASDLVDDPAATDSLFSAEANADKVAVIAYNFLKSNPRIMDMLKKDPTIVQGFIAKILPEEDAPPKKENTELTVLMAEMKKLSAKMDSLSARIDVLEEKPLTNGYAPSPSDDGRNGEPEKVLNVNNRQFKIKSKYK